MVVIWLNSATTSSPPTCYCDSRKASALQNPVWRMYRGFFFCFLSDFSSVTGSFVYVSWCSLSGCIVSQTPFYSATKTASTTVLTLPCFLLISFKTAIKEFKDEPGRWQYTLCHKQVDFVKSGLPGRNPWWMRFSRSKSGVCKLQLLQLDLYLGKCILV